jgi:hypothetical protein
MSMYIGYIGVKYNRLTIIKIIGSNRRGVIALVECDCGKRKEVVLREVERGHTTSCGCRKLQCYMIKHTVACTDPNTIAASVQWPAAETRAGCDGARVTVA